MTQLFVFSPASLFGQIRIEYSATIRHRSEYDANIRYSPNSNMNCDSWRSHGRICVWGS